MKKKKLISICLLVTLILAAIAIFCFTNADQANHVNTSSPETVETDDTDGAATEIEEIGEEVQPQAETPEATEALETPEYPIVLPMSDEVMTVLEESYYSMSLYYSDDVFSYYDSGEWDVEEDCQTYYFDRNGQIFASGNYGIAYPFQEGYACVSREGKYGFIDKTGQEVIPLTYDKATPFSDGLAYFEKGDTYGFMDTTGQEIFTLDCDSVSSFKEGLAYFSINGKYGYIDQTGQVVIAPVYDDAGYFAEGEAKVRLGITMGTINRAGEFKEEEAYKDNEMGKYGYDYSWQLEGTDYYVVRKGEQFGVIAQDGTIKLPIQYLSVMGVYGTMTDIVQGKLIAVTDEQGSRLFSLDDFQPTTDKLYDDISYVGEDCAVVCSNEQYGVVDAQDKVLIPIKYDSIFMCEKDRFIARLGEQEVLLNEKGEELSNWYSDIRQEGACYQCENLDSEIIWMNRDGVEILKGEEQSYVFVQDSFQVLDNYFVQKQAIDEAENDPLVLVNNITPKKKAYHDLQLRYTDRYYAESDYTNLYGTRVDTFRLYNVANINIPVLYQVAESQDLFYLPESNIFLEKDGQCISLCYATESGGTMGGERIQFFYDQENQELTYGYWSGYGGFGGNAGGPTIYYYQNGESVETSDLVTVNQVMGNYAEEDIQAHPELFYREEGGTYTAEDIADAQRATTYYVNDELVTKETWEEISARFESIYPIKTRQ